VNLHDFDYDLPPECIAQTAAEPRDSARLLVLYRADGRLEHRVFRDLPDSLNPGDALVLNQTRVIPARLRGVKQPTGGAVEVLLLERIDDRRWLCWVGGKRARLGTRLLIQGSETVHLAAEVVEVREGAERLVAFAEPIEPYLNALGELPLPPYIHTPLADPERYQTVYGRDPGSVAAPTAGLHFTTGLLDAIRAHGVEIVTCVLHVGPGTFQPVRAEQIADHKLHAEYAELSAASAEKINAVKAQAGRVIAVGTTSVRTLETAAQRVQALNVPGPVTAIADRTTLFITPGDSFRVVDAMVTNFHLPRSTLLMLVSAFAGR